SSFTDRETESDEITNNIKQEIVVISGLSGVGKSELVRKYIDSHKQDYDSVIWINAETYETIKESFYRLIREELDRYKIKLKREDGEERRLKSIVNSIYKAFARDSRKSLLIFDNTEEYAVGEFLSLHTSNKLHILITSNSLGWNNKRANIKVLS